MDEHSQKIGISPNHKLIQTSSTWKQKKGQDTDTYHYDEVDENGNIVAKYVVEDSTSMYPPFGRNITFSKIG